CIVQVRRKYLKGLLSIPCDGRGARRPQGQSFRESVGPAALYQVSAANRVTIYSFGGHMSTLCERPRYAVFSQRLGLIADRLASPSIFLILLKHGLASVFQTAACVLIISRLSVEMARHVQTWFRLYGETH